MPQKKRPFICDCNEPAVKYDSCHNPVCARCLKMEAIRDMYAKKGLTAGVEDDLKDELYNRRAAKKRTWINEPDMKPILLPDALARIEQILKQAEMDSRIVVDNPSPQGVEAFSGALLVGGTP